MSPLSFRTSYVPVFCVALNPLRPLSGKEVGAALGESDPCVLVRVVSNPKPSASESADRAPGHEPPEQQPADAQADEVQEEDLRSLSCRYLQLDKEIRELQAELERLTELAAPALVSTFGVGPDTAATLLISAGSNPQRLRSEAAFASLCGVNPIPASSGKTNRHRLNRGGDRQANSALYRIVLVRLRYEAVP